jgi:hypothetical protein
MTPEKPGIPDDLVEFKHRLEQWRVAHPPRSRRSESTVDAAEIGQRHRLHLTSKPLRLDYAEL